MKMNIVKLSCLSKMTSTQKRILILFLAISVFAGCGSRSNKEEALPSVGEQSISEVKILTPQKMMTVVQACGDLGLLNASECEYKCANCIEAQKVENGEQCFSCDGKKGSMECLKNDYYRDCSSCQEDEICEEVGLILFYESRKTSPQTCYSCLPK